MITQIEKILDTVRTETHGKGVKSVWDSLAGTVIVYDTAGFGKIFLLKETSYDMIRAYIESLVISGKGNHYRMLYV